MGNVARRVCACVLPDLDVDPGASRSEFNSRLSALPALLDYDVSVAPAPTDGDVTVAPLDAAFPTYRPDAILATHALGARRLRKQSGANDGGGRRDGVKCSHLGFLFVCQR
jgi:hypothetical protein